MLVLAAICIVLDIGVTWFQSEWIFCCGLSLPVGYSVYAIDIRSVFLAEVHKARGIIVIDKQNVTAVGCNRRTVRHCCKAYYSSVYLDCTST